MSSVLLRSFWKRWFGPSANAICPAKRPPLGLEPLEDRTVPATLTVTNMTLDSATTPGTLRYELAHANNGDTINIAVAGTLKLTQGSLDVTKSVTINGLGATQDIINGATAVGVSAIQEISETTLSLAMSGLTITGGNTISDGGAISMESGDTDTNTLTLTNCTLTNNTAEALGGAIDVQGSVTLTGCTISGNTGAEGGGISTNKLTMTNTTLSNNKAAMGGGGGAVVYAQATVVDCTISGNTATQDGGGGIALFHFESGGSSTSTFVNDTIVNNKATLGGGVYISGSATAAVSDCTIAGNTATGGDDPGVGGGGGIWVGNVLTLANSIVAENTDKSKTDTAPDIASNHHSTTINYSLIGNTQGLTITSGSHNLLNVNPQLGSLANNGGPTETMALSQSSPAVNSGSNSLIPAGISTDQRGYPRIADGTVDMGAYELEFTTTTIVSSLNPSTAGQTVTFTATVAFTTPGGPIPPGTLTFYINGVAVGSSSLNSIGQATLPYTFSTQGNYVVEAIFVPSDGSVGSNDSLTQVVNASSSTGVIGRRRT